MCFVAESKALFLSSLICEHLRTVYDRGINGLYTSDINKHLYGRGGLGTNRKKAKRPKPIK